MKRKHGPHFKSFDHCHTCETVFGHWNCLVAYSQKFLLIWWIAFAFVLSRAHQSLPLCGSLSSSHCSSLLSPEFVLYSVILCVCFSFHVLQRKWPKMKRKRGHAYKNNSAHTSTRTRTSNSVEVESFSFVSIYLKQVPTKINKIQ